MRVSKNVFHGRPSKSRARGSCLGSLGPRGLPVSNIPLRVSPPRLPYGPPRNRFPHKGPPRIRASNKTRILPVEKLCFFHWSPTKSRALWVFRFTALLEAGLYPYEEGRKEATKGGGALAGRVLLRGGPPLLRAGHCRCDGNEDPEREWNMLRVVHLTKGH